MRRVLLLAYQFPPVGGAGAQRNTKLARHLPELGYELSVVTGPQAAGHRWTPRDESMVAEIHEAVAVHRVEGPEPPWSAGWRRRAERWLRLTWPWQLWWEEQAVPLATRVGREADVDLVYCSLAPFATARAAGRIARALGKPLVLDLEDPWALDEMLTYETALHRRLEKRAMGRALAAADGIVMNTPESAARLVQAFPHLRGKPVTSILNGFDAADFDGPPPVREDDGKLRLVHTGSFHSELGQTNRLKTRLVGGGLGDVHVLSRSPVYLMQALNGLIAERPELTDRIELHLAGRLTPGDRAVFADSPVVREHGFVTHGESIALMRTADLLFLPMHDLPQGRRVAIVPCKTYEYLGSRRPVLAAVPDGDARDLLQAAGHASVVRPTDVDGIRAAILDALAAQEAGRPPREPDPEVLRRVERQELTRQTAAFIDRVAGGSRAAAPAAVGAR